MKILVFNSKGGCGKSLITREIIAAPLGKQIAIAEIDELNKTQEPYKDRFADVIELKKESISDLLIHLNDHKNIVIDVGADNLTATLQTMVEYQLFDDVDKVVIPLGLGRSDSENALKTYSGIVKHCDNIMFAFTMFNIGELFENQYPVFFDNVDGIVENFNDDMIVKINNSDVFLDAQHERKLVVELAQEVDYKSSAITAKSKGDNDSFRKLMRQELNKRSAKILVKNCIMVAHQRILK